MVLAIVCLYPACECTLIHTMAYYPQEHAVVSLRYSGVIDAQTLIFIVRLGANH